MEILSLIISFLFVCIIKSEEITIDVDDTGIVGLRNDVAESFLGIQYATVGERFSESEVLSLGYMPDAAINSTEVPIEGGSINATKFGPSCYQPSGFDSMEFSEECLYLNIWRPINTKEHSSLAVMVWIHGGGFVTGSGSNPLYDGSNLAGGRYVIVVTLNYRLGVFGFMSRDSSGIGGMNGLYDQINALTWIKNNIKKFGGNPDSVTVMGESAGGVSICLLSVSPLASGLFKRAIIQSGECITTRTSPLMPTENYAKTEKFLETMGVELVEELNESNFSADDLIKAAVFTFNNGCIDGWVMPTLPLEYYHGRSDINPDDFIIGSNTYDDPSLLGMPTQAYIARAGEFESYVNDMYGFLGRGYVEDVIDAYSTMYYSSSEVARLAQFNGDLTFRCGTQELAAIIASNNDDGNVYNYVFSQHTDNDISSNLINASAVPEIVYTRWASHTAEIPFMFGNLKYNYVGGEMELPKEKDIALSQEMMARWSNFAEIGVPRMDYIGAEWTEVPWNLEASFEKSSDTPYLNLNSKESEMILSNQAKLAQCTAIPTMAILRSITKTIETPQPTTAPPTSQPTGAPYESYFESTPSPTSSAFSKSIFLSVSCTIFSMYVSLFNL